MPAAAMLIPLAIQAGGAIAGHFAGKKAEANALKRTPEEQTALSGAQGSAKTLGTTGSSLVTQGRDTLASPTGYYQKLLGGDRAAMAEATAAPRAQMREQGRGSQAQLARTGVRGAARDVIGGQINRDTASNVAKLTTGVQPMAANALTGIGGGMMQTGAPMLGQSGSIYSNLLGQGFDNKKFADAAGTKTAAGVTTLANNASNIVSGGMGSAPKIGGWGNFGKFGGTDTGDYSLAENY